MRSHIWLRGVRNYPAGSLPGPIIVQGAHRHLHLTTDLFAGPYKAVTQEDGYHTVMEDVTMLSIVAL